MDRNIHDSEAQQISQNNLEQYYVTTFSIYITISRNLKNPCKYIPKYSLQNTYFLRLDCNDALSLESVFQNSDAYDIYVG